MLAASIGVADREEVPGGSALRSGPQAAVDEGDGHAGAVEIRLAALPLRAGLEPVHGRALAGCCLGSAHARRSRHSASFWASSCRSTLSWGVRSQSRAA